MGKNILAPMGLAIAFVLVFSAMAVQPALASPQANLKVANLNLIKSATKYGEGKFSVGSMMLYNGNNNLNARSVDSLDDIWMSFRAQTSQKVATKSNGVWQYAVRYYDTEAVVRFYVPQSIYDGRSLPLKVQLSYEPVKVVKQGGKYAGVVSNVIDDAYVSAVKTGVVYVQFRGGCNWQSKPPVAFNIYEFELDIEGDGFAKNFVYGLVTPDFD